MNYKLSLSGVPTKFKFNGLKVSQFGNYEPSFKLAEKYNLTPSKSIKY